MAERFERLHKLQENLYVSSAPVIISAGALLKDTQTDSMIVQLKFHSVAAKTIKAVKVSIAAQDVAKQPIQGVEDYQYLDLNIKHGQEFGSNKAIVLQSSVARFFAISALTVVFADESQWLWDTALSLQPLPAASPLHSALTSNEMVKQYQIATNASAQYVPIDEGTIWQCSCGEWNGEPLCSKCKLAKTTAFAVFDKSQLNADMSTRLAAEQAKREAEQERQRVERERKAEEDRILAERAKVRKKKLKIVAGIVSIPLIIVIVFSVVNNAVIIPNSKYDGAMALMDAGKYFEAISAFEALDGYKDSLNKIIECRTAILENKYNDAVSLMCAGKYKEAISAFKALDGYKDSQDKIAVCNTAILDERYNDAIALLDAGYIVKAYEALIALDGYRDSTEKANSIYVKYQLKTAQIGDYIFFGSYEQDNNASNGKETIEWLVLEVKDNKVLLISKYALDQQKYNASLTSVTWESCTLRKWLNNDFINAAFSTDEKEMIPTVTVSADENPHYGANSGNITRDKVFLLSITEADKYFSSDRARQCKPTKYASANGAAITHLDYDTCSWWLRSLGYPDRARCISPGGKFFTLDVDDSLPGVRPVLWIDIDF